MKKILTLFFLCCCGVVIGQSYHIGDVYTAPDGSKGIVYYLLPDGSGGWVVALNDASTSCVWGDAVDVPGLPNRMYTSYGVYQLFMNDTAGYTNTQVIRNYQNNNTYAAGIVDFAHGWVLPSLAQIRMLYSQLPFISSAIIEAGGTDLTTGDYWSSNEQNASNAWAVYFNYGNFINKSKNTSACVRAVRSFSYGNEPVPFTYIWNTGDTTPDITVTPEQTTTYTVIVSASNGCADTVEHTIVVNGAVPQAFHEAICQGTGYQDHGFNLSGAETSEPGTFTFYNTITYSSCEVTDTLYLTVLHAASSKIEQTSCDSYEWNGQTYTQSGAYTFSYPLPGGCDSVVTLQLVIGNTPEVTIVSTDSTICYGDSVTLQASSSPVYLVPAVSVGDILCTDGTIVKPSDFLASGKTAMGVVYYVDATGIHGWAVHLHDQAERVCWSNNTDYDVPGVSNVDNFHTANQYPDFSGYVATQSLWAAGDSIAYPAAHCVDFPNGWYLPDIGQLEILYTEMPMLTPSLQVAGGEPFPTNSSWYYWAATEADHENPGYAWHLESNGRVDYCNKAQFYYDYYSDFSGYSRVRSIRDF